MFGKKKEEEPVVAAVVEKTVEEAVPEEEPQETVIGSGFKFKGDIETTQALTVLGSLEGNILSSSDLRIAKGACYKGCAYVNNIIVEGDVSGIVKVKGLTTLTDGCTFTGKLTTNKLFTEEGADFEGELTMNSAKAPVVPAVQEIPAEEAEEKLEALAEEGDVPVTEADIFG